MALSITNYRITTSMGQVNTQVTYPFLFLLSEVERREFDNIGYSGKTLKGKKTTRTEYLNSLDKGLFKITQTQLDNGNFQEAFLITRVIESTNC